MKRLLLVGFVSEDSKCKREFWIKSEIPRKKHGKPLAILKWLCRTLHISDDRTCSIVIFGFVSKLIVGALICVWFRALAGGLKFWRGAESI